MSKTADDVRHVDCLVRAQGMAMAASEALVTASDEWATKAFGGPRAGEAGVAQQLEALTDLVESALAAMSRVIADERGEA
jgi:hypothetical protein